MNDPGESTRPIIVAGKRGLELPVSRFSVTVEDGPDRGRTALLTSTSLRIGSGPDNDLPLSDPEVSRQHVLLALTDQGISLEDVGSTNGTWLEGARVQSALLPDRVRFRIGSTTLRVLLSTEPMVLFPGEASCLGSLLGRSQAMRDLFALIQQLSQSDLPVLIIGETGTGKELVARALHEQGRRSARPFLILDCGSIVAELLRSEIFGHEKGAFTGADQSRKGVLEAASGGTVFLDEIGEMELGVQPQLLRALEHREICRLGSHHKIPVDFRIVAATNRNLAECSRRGSFRPDLYYRLACARLRLPPLRERLEDIPLLARHFLAECARRNQIPEPLLSDPAVDVLVAREWPGNVRQLKNVMDSVCLLSRGDPITPTQVERSLSGETRARPEGADGRTLEEMEIAHLRETLGATGWNRKEAAHRLGIAVSTLYEKMKRYGLKPPGD